MALAALKATDELWLPVGHLSSWDLHVEHDTQAGDGAGPFTGGGWKLCWHVTVSPWETVDSMVSVLHEKGAEPHFCIGGRKGREHPTVIQLLPLNRAGRALQHTLPPETNRANTIQIEVCATPDGIKDWSDWYYKALGNLAELIRHRVAIPTVNRRRFTDTRRYTGPGFVKTSGHLGHMHVPGNDHTDPGPFFSGSKLIKYIESAPNAL
jgi:hypothetical protein